METDCQYTRDEYFEILRNEQPLSFTEVRMLLDGIEQACSEDPIEAAIDRWYFYGRLKTIAESNLGPEDAQREAWGEILQLISQKLELIQRQPLTKGLVEELLFNRMWRWKPVDALLLVHSLPGSFHHWGDRAKIYYIVQEVARACRDSAQGALREDWELVLQRI